MTLTADSIAILSDLEADARAYDPSWDGVDEMTAMEWEAEAQREIHAEWDAFYAMQAADEASTLDGPIDEIPF